MTRHLSAKLLRADLRANRGHPKEQALVGSYRIAQLLATVPVLGTVALWCHRFSTEVIYGIELRPETRIGPGLRLFHGYATVINTDTRIGANATIHQSVTLGARRAGGGSPLIGRDVYIGAGALVLGDVTVGDGAVIGAGAVVTSDVAAHTTVVGNPARPLPPVGA